MLATKLMAETEKKDVNLVIVRSAASWNERIMFVFIKTVLFTSHNEHVECRMR